MLIYIKFVYFQVGDIVKVVENETFPGDLILISSSIEGGICFIETSSLDGEKNLKPKSSMADTIQYAPPPQKV